MKYSSYGSMKEIEYSFVIDFVKKAPKGVRILSAGCADGKIAQHFNLLGYEAWGVDLQSLENTDSTYGKENWPRIKKERFRQEDMRKMSFPDKFFDYVLCISSIMNIGIGAYGDYKEKDGDRKALEEFMRVLKDDGRIILSLAFGEVCLKPRNHPFRVYDEKRIEELIRGLEILEEHYFYFDTESEKWIETSDKKKVEKVFNKKEIEWFGNAILVLEKSREKRGK